MQKIYMRENSNNSQELINIIKHTKLTNIIMCEIGSFRGESADTFLSTGLVKQIHCIDPWSESYTEVVQEEKMSDVEIDFDNRVSKYQNKVIKLKMESYKAKDILPNNYFDLIYIDGLHDYENCKNDIINFLPKIKSTGFISGHDYHETWPGVISAVNEILGKPDAIYPTASWIKHK